MENITTILIKENGYTANNVPVFGLIKKEINAGGYNSYEKMLNVLRILDDDIKTKNQKLKILISDETFFKAITKWLDKWLINNFVSSVGMPIKHQSLWKIINQFKQNHEIEFIFLSDDDEASFFDDDLDYQEQDDEEFNDF